MEKINNKKLVSIDGEFSRFSASRKSFIYSTLLWMTFVIPLLVMFFFNYFSLPLLFILCLGIWRLSKYWGKKINVVMLPQALTKKVKSSRFYKLYFVEAMKQQWSIALLLSMFFLSCLCR